MNDESREGILAWNSQKVSLLNYWSKQTHNIIFRSLALQLCLLFSLWEHMHNLFVFGYVFTRPFVRIIVEDDNPLITLYASLCVAAASSLLIPALNIHPFSHPHTPVLICANRESSERTSLLAATISRNNKTQARPHRLSLHPVGTPDIIIRGRKRCSRAPGD